MQNYRKFIFNILVTPLVNVVVDVTIVLDGFDFAVVASVDVVVVSIGVVLVDILVVVVVVRFGDVVVEILVVDFGVVVVVCADVFVVLVFVD